ncbi:N-acetyl-1-D-myo-inositol-2-amino-2-deoxy-alpha-D-glucopyranoside deacetylase [Nitriliruptoraceae bacterium ZYF776]|nr:N-acetyl-1-D-myo-inositol-2-amino-2-deoxy-alpha-D-glucopyranoside deacetylase [Profundirhabdus halotolerans]
MGVDEAHLGRQGFGWHVQVRTVGSGGRLPSDASPPPSRPGGPVEPRRTLLCVHPHPDDESIACGGVLARAVAEGHRAVVVTCTGGEEGENLAGIDLGDEDLTSHRRRELADALAALGVTEHHRLGYRDSGMVGAAANDHPDSFHTADLEQAAHRLAAIVREVRPDVVVSDDEQGTYGHPDHVKAHAVTTRAVALAADPVADVAGVPWQVHKRYVHSLARSRVLASHRALLEAGLASPFGDAPIDDPADLPFGTDDELITTSVDVRPWFAAKRAAMAAHRSQIGEDSFFLNTPDELTTDAFGEEDFVLLAGTVAPGPDGLETDLFAGLEDVPRTGAPVTTDTFRGVLGRFATGVTVMTTTSASGEPHGMTANAVSSVSLEPPLVLVCVERGAKMAELVAGSGVFALNILAADQPDVSDTFADPDRPLGAAEFAEVAVTPGVTGAPVFDRRHGFVDCRVWATYDGGDHLIVVGEVVDLGTGASEPLLYHRGGYAHLAGPDGEA